MTEEMRELLAGVTRSTITDLEERSPFGANARARGDVTAEQRWLHLRGSSHSTSLLRSMMLVAEEVSSRVDGPSPSFSSTSPPPKPSSTNDSAEDLSTIMQRAHNSTNGIKKSTPEPATVTKSKSKSNVNSSPIPSGPFSWTTYLKSSDVEVLEPAVGATTTRRKSAGANAESSPSARSSSGGSTSPPPTNRVLKTASKSEKSSSTMHRRLGRNEMNTFGLIPLEDTPRLLQCRTCQRILMDHVYTSHTSKCRYTPPVKQEPVVIESHIRSSSTPPPTSETAKKAPFNVSMVPSTSYSPLPTTAATPPPGLAKVSNGRPSIKQSAASRQAQASSSPSDAYPKQTSAPKTITVRTHSANALNGASQPVPVAPANIPVATPQARTYVQVVSQGVMTAPTPVRVAASGPRSVSPQTPPTRPSPVVTNYTPPNGSVVMVTSPRSGLKASVGQSVTTPPTAPLPSNTVRYQTQYQANTPSPGTTSMNHSPPTASTAANVGNYGPYTSVTTPVQSGARAPAKRARQENVPSAGSPPSNAYQVSPDGTYSSKRVSYGVPSIPPPGPSPSRSINASRNAAPSPTYAAAAARASFTTTPTKSIIAPSPGPSKRPPLASPTPVHAQYLPSNSQPMNWVRTASMAPLTGSSHGPSFAPTFSSLPAANYQLPPSDAPEEFVSPAAFQGSNTNMDPDYAMFTDVETNSYFPPSSADDLY